jgi:homoserine O-acetyltransferase
MLRITQTIFAVMVICLARAALAADYPPPTQGDFVVRDFRFRNGQTLPELRLHYRTLGQPRTDASGIVRNAVLIMHGTTGSGNQFFREEFAAELFGKDQLLDASRYFIIFPDAIGHGQSSKPSDGLRAKFPNYGYLDMIEAQHRLVTEGLKVNHLRLVMGTSMGGMHTWLWGQQYPQMMDALMPLASLPGPISGRNRMWRKTISDAIRNDPQWNGGDYTQQPPSLRTAAQILSLMASNPVLRYQEAPTGEQADKVLETTVTQRMQNYDANDVLYAIESSRDYDPAPGLEKITAPLLAINSADDLINPPELQILEREIKRVKRGRAIVIPLSPETRGHGTHTRVVVWKGELERFLKETEGLARSEK